MTVLNRLQQASHQLQPGPLYQSFGTLVRVNGMLLTVAGGQYTLGQRYQVEGQAGHWIEAEVVGFDREQAFLMPLTDASELTTGARVRPQAKPALTVSHALLGRVVDGLLQPLDDGPPLQRGEQISSQNMAVNPMQKKGVTTPLDVGIKAINGLFTVGQGQRLGLFAGSGVGKSKLLGMMTRFTEAEIIAYTKGRLGGVKAPKSVTSLASKTANSSNNAKGRWVTATGLSSLSVYTKTSTSSPSFSSPVK